MYVDDCFPVPAGHYEWNFGRVKTFLNSSKLECPTGHMRVEFAGEEASPQLFRDWMLYRPYESLNFAEDEDSPQLLKDWMSHRPYESWMCGGWSKSSITQRLNVLQATWEWIFQRMKTESLKDLSVLHLHPHPKWEHEKGEASLYLCILLLWCLWQCCCHGRPHTDSETRGEAETRCYHKQGGSKSDARLARSHLRLRLPQVWWIRNLQASPPWHEALGGRARPCGRMMAHSRTIPRPWVSISFWSQFGKCRGLTLGCEQTGWAGRLGITRIGTGIGGWLWRPPAIDPPCFPFLLPIVN